MNDTRTAPMAGDRLAKVMARSGLCSRRDAEEWIKAGRVVVNGRKVLTPAFNVSDRDEVTVDGTPLAAREGTRVWLYHKPAGLVVTEKDPEGRPTIFETLAATGLPRVLSIGRLDINTEGLLLLTNDGGLKRVLELPATGWLRKYRVRAHGSVTQARLDQLRQGVEVDGVKYGPIEARLEREQGANVWMEIALREGKNREIKNVLLSIGLEVNRLIRVSFGPFQLGDLPIGAVETVKARVLKDQLGKRLAEEAAVDFEAEMPVRQGPGRRPPPSQVEERQFGRGTHTVSIGQQRFRFTDRAEKTPQEMEEQRRLRPRPGRPGRSGSSGSGVPTRPEPRAEDSGPERHIHFDDGREPAVFQPKSYGKKPRPDESASADRPHGGKRPFAARPAGPRRAADDARSPRHAAAAERLGPGRAERPAGGAPRSHHSADGKSRPFRQGSEGTARPARAAPGRSRAADQDAPRPPRSFAGKPRPAGDAADRPRPSRGTGKPVARADAPRPSRPPPGKPGDGHPGAGRPTGARRPTRPGGPTRGSGGPTRGPSRPRGK